MNKIKTLALALALGSLLSAIVLTPARSQAAPNPSPKSLKRLSRGLPDVAKKLKRSSFVRVKAYRLKNARVLWVNWDLLAEMGIAFPPEGLTPEFEEQILNEFAYLIPSENDSPDEFMAVFKYFYSSKYGGSGMGLAKGDGRAAGAGLFQEKGINPTPNVQRAQENFSSLNPFDRLRAMYSVLHHTHGGLTLVKRWVNRSGVSASTAIFRQTLTESLLSSVQINLSTYHPGRVPF